jgi:two-component system cell cycle sensor histidine kinase/response regulator CckA
VRLTVVDSGPGIPPEMHHLVFEPFFTTKAIGKGTGLGLATVYGIVSRHGGWISLGPERPGTTIHIELPVAECEVNETLPVGDVSELPFSQSNKKPLRGMRILLAEDEPAIRQLASQILVLSGAEVVDAADGEKAIEIFRQEVDAGRRFDIAVLDVLMPGRGGPAASREIRGMFPDFPVLFCSGYSNPHLREELSIGKIDQPILIKPYRPSELVSAILETIPPIKRNTQ